MSEYDRTDAGLYDSYSTGLDGDEAFYVEEAARADGLVLEIACGTGRIMIPIAESGVSVVGLDRAPAMLEVARRKVAALADDTQRRIQIVEGDMRTFSLERRFRRWRSYRTGRSLHLMTAEDQRRGLDSDSRTSDGPGPAGFQRVRSQHRADRRLHEIAQGHPLTTWDRSPIPKRDGASWCRIRGRYDPLEQTLEEHRFFEEVDDEGRVLFGRPPPPVYLRYVHRFEMQHPPRALRLRSGSALRGLPARSVPAWKRAGVGGQADVIRWDLLRTAVPHAIWPARPS